MSTARLDIAADGTRIAVWVEGTGPALVMVHGSIADHTTFDPFIAVLRNHFTTFAMDRRGFGATPDTGDYTIDVDFADVAAVVDAVAARTGGPVALWGHSYGANCAIGGAARTTNVSHLILYEPSLGLRYPPGSIEAIEAALATGDNDAAIVAVLVDILEMTDEEVDALRQGPLWAARSPPRPPSRGSAASKRAGPTNRASSTPSPHPPCCSKARTASPASSKRPKGPRPPSPERASRFSTATATSPTRPTPAMVTALIREFISAGHANR